LHVEKSPGATAPAQGKSDLLRPAAGAAFAISVLTAMNLLNYVDRWVPSAVKELIKSDLHLTDAQTSYPLTAFVIVYMIASPIFGSLEGRWSRRYIIAAGVAFWSLCTGAAALAHGFWTFLIARALVGVGEAAYATLSPALISDFYPPARRNRALTIFYVAIPVGAAIGFTVGGKLGESHGWRTAFLAVGLPGILAALSILFVKEPVRGGFDPPAPAAAATWPEALRALSKNRAYVLTVAGYTAVTFASGAMADWFSTYLIRYRAFSTAEAASIVGNTAVLGGLGGTVLGGAAADWLRGKIRQPYLGMSALSMAPATALAVAALFVHGRTAIFASLLGAQLCLWCYNGPINTVLVNCVPADLRTRAFSLSILLIHLLGDALSPSAVGIVSDAAGLRSALWMVPISLVLCTGIWGWAWRTLPEESLA